MAQTQAASFAANMLHTIEFLYYFAVQGGAQGALTLSGNSKLPIGAVVTRFWAVVETAVTSGGSATVAFGTVTDADAFLAATAKASLGACITIGGGPAAAHVQVAVANDRTVNATVATADLTAGKIRCFVEFWMPSNISPEASA